MKISISSHCFSAPINAGEMSVLDVVKAVKDVGAEGVEFTTHDDSIDIEIAKKIKAEADRLGIEITNYAIDADLLNGARGRTIDEEIKRLRGQIDIAEILGVKNIRHDVLASLGEYKSFDLALPIIAERTREISRYAESKGIKTTVENHGRICQDPERLERLYNAVDYKNFGLLCDIGNFITNDIRPDEATAKIAPYTVFAHVKDYFFKDGSSIDKPDESAIMTRGGNYIFPATIGYGAVPITKCLRILKSVGYDGYVSIETYLENPMSALKIGVKNLWRYIENA